MTDISEKQAVRRRQRSSVEGVLRTMADYGSHVEARLEEHRTARNVRVRVDGDFLQGIEGYFRQRVIIEGTVSYSKDGQPLYVSRVTKIRKRTNVPITRFIGAATGLSQDMPAEDYISRMYGDDD